MKSRLKNLYKYLIENRKHEVKGWHDAYRDFYGEVEKIRERIRAGETLILIAKDQSKKSFLKQLLFDDNNGIAARGQSTLSHENFGKYIEESDFIRSLEGLIREPDKESFSAFEKSWRDTAQRHGAKNNPLLVNRVAAACTLSVSTTADSGKFNQVFSWLTREQIIPAYPVDQDQDWFSKNIFLMKIIKDEFSDELRGNDTDEFYLSQFVWVLYENLSNPFSLKKQIVKYGAPGTGKTYQARQQTSLLFDIWKEEFAPNSSLKHGNQIELVQFHPSFSYEDFMEGLRPVMDDNGAAQLTLQNGVFKEFCRTAGKWEIDYQNLKEKPKGSNGKDKTFDERDQLSISDLLPYREQLSGEHWQYIFDLSDSSKLVSDAVPPFFFIIDEVNRAELSRVFGELMYCLEYRGIAGAIKTQYANLNSPETRMLNINGTNQFFIPTNVYLIGTMNTIDRSVESFDFALRRRFKWEEVKPDMGLLRYHLASADEGKYKHWTSLADNLGNLNSQIVDQPLLGHDYQIGHAYLMNLKYATSLTVAEVRERVWDDCIRPLLQEYLRGTGKEAELIGSQEQAGTFEKTFGVR